MVSQLQCLLENAHPGFAYELLAVEIDIENIQENLTAHKINTLKEHQTNTELIEKLTKLIQLYMLGIEVLESNGDTRYKYFNNKIQGLMKRKHIIQQLHIASTGKKATKEVMKQANEIEIENRKNQYEIQVFLNSEQRGLKKIKEIIQIEDKKYSNFKKKLNDNIKTQNDKLDQRIKLRKMKSDNQSINKFDLGSNPPDEKHADCFIENDESVKNKLKEGPRKKLMKAKSAKNLFETDSLKRERKGSIQKRSSRILQL